ncbi:MAG: GNAT family N-acetyltransferase [Actinomycetota bacterium]|nr:GNAT family N-acetyltransferase [Actinomycetota bacterium]
MPDPAVQPHELRQFVKKLALPAGFAAPAKLSAGDLVATALSRADLDDDVQGINSSVALIQRMRGGGWPTGEISEDYNFVDLVWHEQEFREGTSFSYVVRNAAGDYLGCCYLYPMGQRTELKKDLLAHDVDVSWWVTGTAYEAGYYEKLYAALRGWVTTEFPFTNPYYSNTEIPG